jgi:alpha-1,2-mannosyltransferase
MVRERSLARLALFSSLVLLAACWLSSGLAPFTEAVVGARDPVDFARDYVSARVRLDDGRRAPPVDEEGNARADRLGAPRVVLLGGPFHIHPPPATLAVLPVAWLSWHGAARVWIALSLAALVWLAWSLERLLAPDRPPVAWRFGVLAALLPFWPPVLHCLEKGQWSIGLAALLAAGFRALERDRPARAGALFGLAASLKATPAVLLGFLVLRDRRAATAMLMVAAALALLATAVSGVGAWVAFFADVPRNVAAWSAWLANTVSLQGVFARLTSPSPYTRALVDAPGLARVAFIAFGVALVAGAAAVGWRRRARGEGDARSLACWSAAWMALPVVLNPLGWTHVAVMLLVPMAVAFRAGGPRTRLVAAGALVVLTIPRQSLVAWAGSMPLAPATGLVVGAHAFAAAALTVALLADGAARPPVAAPRLAGR